MNKQILTYLFGISLFSCDIYAQTSIGIDQLKNEPGYAGTFGGEERVSPYHPSAWWVFDSITAYAQRTRKTTLEHEVTKTKMRLSTDRLLLSDSVIFDVVFWEHWFPFYSPLDPETPQKIRRIQASHTMVVDYLKKNQPDYILIDGEPFLPKTQWSLYNNDNSEIDFDGTLWGMEYPSDSAYMYDISAAIHKYQLLPDTHVYGMEDTLILGAQKNALYSKHKDAYISSYFGVYRSFKALIYSLDLYREKKAKRITLLIGYGHARDYLRFSSFIPMRVNFFNKTGYSTRELFVQ